MAHSETSVDRIFLQDDPQFMRSQRKLALVAAFVCAAGSVLAQGTTQTVVPFGFESQNGNTSDGALGQPSQLQQLFRGSYLATQWSTPVMITEVAFRVTDGSPSYSSVVPRVEIRFSTSSHTPDNMSLSYLVNRGSDETTVYLHDNVSLFGSVRAGVNPFDLRFRLDRPFAYDPNAGSLLMYMQTGQPSPGARQIDSHNITIGGPPPTAYVGNSGPFAGGQVVPYYSIVTEFSWIAVPEPSALSLIGLALACLAANSLRRRSFHPLDNTTTPTMRVER